MCEKNSDNCIFIMLLCPQLYVAVIPYIKATKVPFSSTKKKTSKNYTDSLGEIFEFSVL